jgi:hypothetical protein
MVPVNVLYRVRESLLESLDALGMLGFGYTIEL